jgi:hypothetical protein
MRCGKWSAEQVRAISTHMTVSHRAEWLTPMVDEFLDA